MKILHLTTFLQGGAGLAIAELAAARAASLGLGVWTVNDEAAMRRMLALGVDILTTDRPDLARRLVAR